MEGRPLDENELIARARSGDVSAYGDLVKMYQSIAQRTAYVVCGDASEAQDIVQSAFVKAYVALGRFAPERPFRPWLLSIVGNEARNARRAAGRRTGLELRLAERLPRDDAAPSPEAAALGEDARRHLVEALRDLDEPSRDVVACRFLLGLSEHETADVLAIPRGTVKSRLSRALDRLRARMEDTHD